MNDQNSQNSQNQFFPGNEPPVNEGGVTDSTSPQPNQNPTPVVVAAPEPNQANVLPVADTSQTQDVSQKKEPNEPVEQIVVQPDTSLSQAQPVQDNSPLSNPVQNTSSVPVAEKQDSGSGDNLLSILEKKVQEDDAKTKAQGGLVAEQTSTQNPNQNPSVSTNVVNSLKNELDTMTTALNNTSQPQPAMQGTSQANTLPQTPIQQSIPQAGPPTPQTANTMTQAPSKKPFPKFVLFILLGIVLLILILGGFVLFQNSQKTATVGTKGEIEWWGVTMDESTMIPLIEQFEKEHEGVNVTYTKQSPKDYRERLANALASGSGPDIFEIHNTWPAMFSPHLSVLPENVMTKSQFDSSFYPIMTTDLVSSRGVIAMPLVYDALTLYVNTDVFTAAALEPPTYWSDLQSIVDRDILLQVDTKNQKILQSPVALGITNNVDHWPEVVGLMMFQNSVNFTNLSTESMESVLNFYKYFSEKKKVWDSTLPESTIAFARNQVAMYFGPTRRAQEIVQINPSLRFKTVPLPQIQPEKPTDPVYSYATYWAYGVYERSNDKQISWEFLEFLANADSLNKLNQTLQSEGKIPVLTSRPDLNLVYADHPILGSVFALAKDARSWYLADETYDGATGLNSQTNKLFEAEMSKKDPLFSSKVISLLAQFGIRQTTTTSSN